MAFSLIRCLRHLGPSIYRHLTQKGGLRNYVLIQRNTHKHAVASRRERTKISSYYYCLEEFLHLHRVVVTITADHS